MAIFSDPFKKPLADLSWKRSHAKTPTKHVQLLMDSIKAVGQPRTVKIDSNSVVLRDQGADICEAANRLGWSEVSVQLLIQTDTEPPVLEPAIVHQLIALADKGREIARQLREIESQLEILLRANLKTPAACAVASTLVPVELEKVKIFITELKPD